MTCYLPPCCNLSSSPIRQPLTASAVSSTLFRYSAIPGFLRGSSTSARRTVKSQPLATSAEVALAASFYPLDVPSSWFFVPSPPPAPRSFPCRPGFPPRRSDAFFSRTVDSHSRKIDGGNRIVKRRSDTGREGTLRTASYLQNKQSGVRERTLSSSLPRSRSLPRLFVFLSQDIVIFFRK